MSTVQFANGPKRSTVQVLGGEKTISKLAALRPTAPQGGHAGLILSIPAPEVSLGSPRVVLYTVSRLHRMRRRFQHISANSLSSAAHKTMNSLALASRALGRRIDGVCGTGDHSLPDLPREASRSRSAPEKSVQFGPDGAPFPSKTSITRGPPVVAVAVSLDPILPQR